MIIVKEITLKKDFRAFVNFPFQLYKNSPYWVPPIIKEELTSMDATKNPVFKNAEASFFLAYKDDKIVGRVAAIINWIEVNEQQKKKMRFGWFDVIDDIEVTKKLLEKVYEIGIVNGLEYVEGPVGFSNMDKAGMLIEGFKERNTMITWYNYAYYPKHLEALGFTKQAEWVEFKIQAPKVLPEKVKKYTSLVKNRYKLQVLQFKNSKEMLPYVDEMFGLLNKAYSVLQSFVPTQQYQIDHYKEKYIPYIHPDFITCIADENGKLIAFAITMPSFAKALQKAKGKLFPFGWFHFWKAQRKNDAVDFYLIGIDPEYQKKGVTAIIFYEMFHTFTKRKVSSLETNPQLEENKAIQALWKNYDHHMHKRRRTYTKGL